MNLSFRVFAAVFVLSFASSVCAGNLQSQVVQVGIPLTITVSGSQFLTIQNFTQEGPATIRGSVSVMPSTGFGANPVLTATILDPNNTMSLEPINNVVIAGPTTVTVTAGDTNCFITYRKADDD